MGFHVRFASGRFVRWVLLALLLVVTDRLAQGAPVWWINSAGGNWSVATNWNTGAVPTGNDDVSIEASGRYVVTQDVHVAISSLTLGGGAEEQVLTNGGFTLTLNGAGTVKASGVVGLSGGSLAGLGNLVVGGRMAWNGGDISGAITVATNGLLTIGGSTTKGLNGTGRLVNYGSMVWSGSNDIQTANSAQIINQAGALFDLQNNQSLTIWNGGAITNFGVLRKSAGGGTTLINVPLHNFGTLEVQSGTVAYGPGSQFDEGTAFTGKGTNLVYGGTVTFNGAISSQNLEIRGPTIAGDSVFSGVVNWTGGELSSGSWAIATNGVLNIGGSSTKGLNGTGRLVNYGSIVWSGTNDIQTANSARVINQAGALFEIQNDQSFTIWNGGAITNLGTLRKSVGNGTTLITVPLHNFGTLDVQSGTVAYGAGSQFDAGTAFTGRGTNLVYNGTVTFNGAISSENLEIGGSTIAGDSIFSGVLNWSSGELHDGKLGIATNGLLNIGGSTARALTGTGTLMNYGTVVWSGTNDIQTLNAARIINQPGALFDIQNNQSLTIWNGGEITNLGTLRKSASSGNTFINVPLINLATVDVQSGTLTLGNFAQADGRLSLGLNSLTDFGQLAFADNIAFNGTLAVTLRGDYTPKAGDAFALITYPSRAGTFANFDLPSSHAWQTDSSIYGPAAITLTVLNARPMLNAVADQFTDEERLLSFSAAGIDPDPGQTLSYSLLNPPEGAVVDPRTGLFSWTPNENQGPSTNVITVQVTDSGQPSLSATRSFTVAVREVNGPPVLRPQTNRVANEMSVLTITNSATDPDLPSNALTYQLISPPDGASMSPEGVITWTPSEAQGPGVYTLTTVATDFNPLAANEQHLSATNSFKITVNEVNQAPVLAAIPILDAIPGVPLRWTNSASDTDWPANSLAFDLVSAPSGMTIETRSGLLSWVPSAGQAPSTNSVVVRVTDDGVPPLSDMKQFMVVAYPLPSLLISRSGTGVKLEWPSYAADFHLQVSTNPFSTSPWCDSTNVVHSDAGIFRVADAPTWFERYFRLRYLAPP